MANTVKIGISASDEGFKSTMQNAAKSAAELGNAMTGAGGKSKTLNGQLREAKKSAMELTMQWRALDDNMKNSDFGRNLQSQLQQVLDKAGELQDIKGDVANEIKNIASDTRMWDGAAQGIGILSSSIQGLASVVGLCGGNTEAFTKALTVMKGVEAATNTVIQIGNALQKDSALMVMLRAMRTKMLAAAQTQATTATVAQTAATEAQTVAQAANNAVAMANPYVAVAAAIIGITAAIWGMVSATQKSTDELNENSTALKAHEERVNQDKESQKRWADDVATSAGNQLATYRLLQKKWQECNGDVKLQGKFMRDYKKDIDSLKIGVNNLVDAENAFVKNTNNVVNAIIARARAEAYKAEYQKEVQREIQITMDKSVAGGGSYYTLYRQLDRGKNSASGSEIQAYERATGKSAITGGGGQSSQGYLLTPEAQKWIDNERRKAAQDLKAHRLAESKDRQKFLENGMAVSEQAAQQYADAAGIDIRPDSNPYAGSGGKGGHGSSGGKGGHGSSGGKGGSGSNEPQAKEYSIDWYNQQINDIKNLVSKGLFKDNAELEAYLNTIEQYTQAKEKLEIAYGFKESPFEPAETSLAGMQKKLQNLQDDLKNGIIPDEDLEKTKQDIEKLEDDITAKELQLGIKLPPKTMFEAFELAHKYKNDWKDLTKYITDYGAKADEFAAAMQKYEDDLKAYNDAWNTYNSNMSKYNEQQKQYAKYNELLKKREELEKKHDDDQISDDKYEKQLRSLDEQIDKLANQLWPAVEDAEKDAINPFTELAEKYDKGLLTLEQYNAEYEKLCDTGIELEGVISRGFAKPIKPKLELPKKPFNPLQSATLEEIFPALDNIPEHVSQLMQSVEQKLNQDDLNVYVRAELLNVRDQLQQRLDDITQGKITIKAKVVPTFSTEFGSDADLRASYENAQQNFQQIMSDFDMGLIKTSDEAIEKLKEINKQLTDMGLKPIIIDIKPGWQQDLDNAANSLNQIGNIMGQIGEDAESKQLDAAKLIAQAIANIWLGYSEATAQAAKLGPWAWAGFSIGALGQVIGIISAMNKYESGGIVGGSYTMGDRMLVRVNSGEMILNKRQQSNLFKALDHGIDSGSSTTGPTTVRIKGEDLYLSMHNHYKRTKKSPFK